MAQQSRQKFLFHFPSNSAFSRVYSTCSIGKGPWKCCSGKPASPPVCQCYRCTSWWFWPADTAWWAEHSPSYPLVHRQWAASPTSDTISACEGFELLHFFTLGFCWQIFEQLFHGLQVPAVLGLDGLAHSELWFELLCWVCLFSASLYCSGKPHSEQAAVGAGSFFSVLSRSGISLVPVWADLRKPLFWFVRLLGLFFFPSDSATLFQNQIGLVSSMHTVMSCNSGN